MSHILSIPALIKHKTGSEKQNVLYSVEFPVGKLGKRYVEAIRKQCNKKKLNTFWMRVGEVQIALQISVRFIAE